MATNTTNYNLIKPDLIDIVDIGDINTNMDTIDGAMNSNAVATRSIQETSEKTAAYTLVVADAGLIVQMNASGAVNLTVPTNGTQAFPIGSIVGVYNRSSNAVTVVGAGGVTVRNAGTVGQFAEASLRKRGTDEWVMVGG